MSPGWLVWAHCVPHALDRFLRYLAAVNLSLAVLNAAPIFLLDGAVAVRPLLAAAATLWSAAAALLVALARKRSSDDEDTLSLEPHASVLASAPSDAPALAVDGVQLESIHRSLIELLENPLKKIADRRTAPGWTSTSLERLPFAARAHVLWLAACSDERVCACTQVCLRAGTAMLTLNVAAAALGLKW